MLASGCQILHNLHFTQYKAVHLSISLFLILTWVCHWSAFLYEWPNEAKERKAEICPFETPVNQCDIFTPELRLACRPHFSGWQHRLLYRCGKEGTTFELSTHLTHKQWMPATDWGGNLHSDASVGDFPSASTVLSEAEVRVICSQFINPATDWIASLSLTSTIRQCRWML